MLFVKLIQRRSKELLKKLVDAQLVKFIFFSETQKFINVFKRDLNLTLS
jgi:hypothetical protein